MDSDFWSFRKMITPVVIQALFILGLVLVVIGSLMTMFRGGFAGFIAGLFALVIGVIMWRVYCELLILLFRIYEELKAIREGRPPTDQGFPVIMPTTPAAAAAAPPPPTVAPGA